MIELDFSRILAIYSALIVFGALYNLVISRLEKRGYLEGFTWFAVAVGTGVTVLAIAMISWQCAVIALGAFVFSGSPMIIGAVSRYVVRRERSQRSLIDEVVNDR